MPPGSASASNPAPTLSKGELDQYYSRIHVESVGSDGKKVLANVARNLSDLLDDYDKAWSNQTPDDDKAWTNEKSQGFLTDVIGQVKAILGDKANKLTKDDKEALQESLSKADQLKDKCKSKLEAVKTAPNKNGDLNPNASETVEKNGKGKRRHDPASTSQSSTSRDQVHPPTTEKKPKVTLRGITLKEGADRKVAEDCISHLKEYLER